MDPRTTASGRRARTASARRRPPAAVRRPALYLAVAAAGAVMVSVLVGTDPAAQAEAGPPESVSVAAQLGLTAQSGPAEVVADLQPLEELAASRVTREAAETAAQQAQAVADQAVLDQQKAAEEAAARAAAEAAAAAEAKARAEAEQAARERAAREEAEAADAAPSSASAPSRTSEAAAPAPAPAASGVVARINNSAGPVKPVVQAAANAVMSNVPGISSVGGTRASAADPGGHPSGLAADYMCSASVGDAVVAYHIAHWDELGVDYLIWEQRMLSSPGGSWKPMENRGSATANHFDHVHVNYRG